MKNSRILDDETSYATLLQTACGDETCLNAELLRRSHECRRIFHASYSNQERKANLRSIFWDVSSLFPSRQELVKRMPTRITVSISCSKVLSFCEILCVVFVSGVSSCEQFELYVIIVNSKRKL